MTGQHDIESYGSSVDLTDEEHERGINTPRANVDVIKELGSKFGKKIFDGFDEAKNFVEG